MVLLFWRQYRYTVAMAPKPNPRLRRFLIAKEVIMVTLATLCLVGLVLEHLEHLSESQLYLLEYFEYVVGFVFLCEFGFEWYYARDRRKYIRHHWVFLIAALPIPSMSWDVLRGIRILRLLRLLKIYEHFRYEYNTRLFEP